MDAAALTANYKAIQRVAGAEVLAVIKARAYGHGAERCAPILVRAGARWLGVTCASEGQQVRAALDHAGLEADILVMSGSLPKDVPAIVSAHLIPVIWTTDHIDLLAGIGCRVHVEVDTGMGRQGVRPGQDLATLLARISAAGLRLDGLFTHFCSSEVANSNLTLRQRALFEAAVQQTVTAGLTPAWLHAANSSAVDNETPEPSSGDWLTTLAAAAGSQTMVRTGLALYGYCLPIEGGALHHLSPALQPVLTWKARILAVRDLAPGDTVGYNATFIAGPAMKVALLPVGYADGLRRELSHPHGWVMVQGHPAPILGRISMNLTVVDVTAIPAASAGDEATLLGPGITAEDHARLARTISYEILCGIHPCG
nr:alanine racemase [Granulicella tundricola]